MEAMHAEWAGALGSDAEVFLDGEPINPRLHVTMHMVVANRLLADDPPETWQTVQRLAALGYDWHNVMHMIAAVVTEDIHNTLAQRRLFDPVEHAKRLNELPGDWPPPQTDEPG